MSPHMADENEKNGQGMDELKVLYDYHVDEVAVEALEVTTKEAELIMKGWGAPGEDPDRPAIKAEPGVVAASVAKKDREETTKKPPESKAKKAIHAPPPKTNWRELLVRPSEWFSAATQFVLYSGITRNNPLIVTIRLILVVSPIILSGVMTYWTMTVMLPKRDAILGGKLVESDSGKPQVLVAGKTLDILLPDGFQLVDLEEFLESTPFARDAVRDDKQRLMLAARSPDKPHHFVTVGVGTGPAASATSRSDFRRNLDQFIRQKDFASSIQQGANQGIAPYGQTQDSISYGLMRGTSGYDGPVLVYRQYSCLLFTGGRPIILNVGYSCDVSEADGDPAWCQSTLAAWRDQLLAAE